MTDQHPPAVRRGSQRTRWALLAWPGNEGPRITAKERPWGPEVEMIVTAVRASQEQGGEPTVMLQGRRTLKSGKPGKRPAHVFGPNVPDDLRKRVLRELRGASW